MKRDFSGKILSYNGKPLYAPLSQERVTQALELLEPEVRDQVEKALIKVGTQPMTFAEACAAALVGSTEKVSIKARTKLARLRLAERLFAGGMVEITPDERDDIKVMVDKMYPEAIVAGRVEEMLEGE